MTLTLKSGTDLIKWFLNGVNFEQIVELHFVEALPGLVEVELGGFDQLGGGVAGIVCVFERVNDPLIRRQLRTRFTLEGLLFSWSESDLSFPFLSLLGLVEFDPFLELVSSAIEMTLYLRLLYMIFSPETNVKIWKGLKLILRYLRIVCL